MTPAEQKLWQHLRNRRLFELKFRRQHPVGRFILDFYCYEHPLIVEVDGGIHELQTERDQMPTEWLQQQGYRVIRFKNEEVISNIEGVLTWNSQSLRKNKIGLIPGPFPKGRRGSQQKQTIQRPKNL